MYNNKLNAIIKSPKLKKKLLKRKEKNLKENERIITLTRSIKKSKKKFSDALYSKLKPIGIQSPRLYGLAKIYKVSTTSIAWLSIITRLQYKWLLVFSGRRV